MVQKMSINGEILHRLSGVTSAVIKTIFCIEMLFVPSTAVAFMGTETSAWITLMDKNLNPYQGRP